MTTKRWNREKSRAGERPEESEEHRCKKKPRVYIIIIISFKYQNRPRIKKKKDLSRRVRLLSLLLLFTNPSVVRHFPVYDAVTISKPQVDFSLGGFDRI